jgi:hypothetical protein
MHLAELKKKKHLRYRLTPCERKGSKSQQMIYKNLLTIELLIISIGTI